MQMLKKAAAPSKFMVEMLAIDTWVDAGWFENGKPQRFPTRAKAQEELDAYMKDVTDAFHKGDIKTLYTKDEYRVVPV